MKRGILLLVSIFCLTLYTQVLFAYNVENLTCEWRTEPLGIDVKNPLLAWQLTSVDRNQWQSAYEIIVSDNMKDINRNKGNVWNTGKIKSREQNNIEYAGKPLKSFAKYYWKVRSYDKDGNPSAWSETASWEMAMLSADDWQAEWIGDGSKDPGCEEDFYKNDPAPMFRKEFFSENNIKHARFYISGLGYYDAYINGQKVGNDYYGSGWTSYDKRILYTTYDVTDLVKSGENCIGVILGNGFYNPLPMPIFTPLRKYLTIGRPCMIAELRITYDNGKTEIIPTDTSWETASSPILRNNVYLGEVYDARLESPGWNLPSNERSQSESVKSASVASDISDDGVRTEDLKWKQAQTVSAPAGILCAQRQPAVKVTAVVKPVRMTETRKGEFVFDMGQNFAGVVRLKVQGERGTKITIRYGEDVYSDGSLNVMTTVAGQKKKIWDADRSAPGQPQTAWQEDCYILKGDGVEVWNPRFTFHGFRYVEITGFPGRPTLDNVEGLRMSADLKHSGTFQCSNELINRINKAVEWTFLSNVFSVQSDCPGREKLGYGGDLVATGDAFCYMFDMANFHTKTVYDYRDSRRESGAMTETAPYMGIADKGFGNGSGPIGWQLAFGYTQKKLYEYYGNKRIIADNYDIFKKQVEFLRQQADGNIIADCIGDHETLDVRPNSLTATAHYYNHVKLLAEFAELLDKDEDKAEYDKLAEDIKNSFINKFYKGDGIYDIFNQTTQAFALGYDLIPEGERDKVLSKLLETINNAQGHIRTGIFATPLMLNTLRESGHNDIAYEIVTKKDFPGWGYMIEHGATTIWETWAYSDNIYSHNHPMFGTVAEWFYRSLLGINSLAPGFKEIEIKPQPEGDLEFARGAYSSLMGDIAVDWKRGEYVQNGDFEMNVSIPVGVKAKIYVPNRNGKNIYESGHLLNLSDSDNGIVYVEKDKEYSVFEAGSGNYRFVVK